MNFIYPLILALGVNMPGSFQTAIVQVFPPVATGIYQLSNGNELRLQQTGSDVSVFGNLIDCKNKILAQVEGNYDRATGKLELALIHCVGEEEELLWYFSRNRADRAEVYLGEAGKETKVTAARISGNPQLEFTCMTSRRKVKKIIRKDNRQQKIKK